MIKSMTGFGQAVYDNGNAQLSIEVKSLNSKFFDLTLRVPKAFADRELEMRNIISEKLERGKVSVTLEYVRTGDDEIRQSYNVSLFKSYFRELKYLADEVGVSAMETIFNLALASPDVIQVRLRDEVSEEEWQWIRNAFLEVIAKCDTFRVQEGKSLHTMLAGCCSKIR